MTLPAGTRLGSYEINAKLGEGGMGQVYRASDTRLRRDVAIKVLPEAFTRDAERLARFEREAQVLAQLHHPNISSIFGLEDAGGSRALVMELVEGPTLSERIASGPIPVDESLAIARQIAEALEEAHDKGIVHRDLKPANVKITPGGTVKVLDFGLAKALDPGGTPTSSSQVSLSPTLTHAATQMGMILGTAAYMAPEQAAGTAVDRRADVWSFGVVLFEMLTGRRLFDGETVSHVLASVLKDTPDFTSLPAQTPERIVDLLRRCLRKKPRERLQSIGDARLVIEEVLADPRSWERAPAVAAATPGKLGWIVGGAGLLAAAAFAALWLGSSREAPAPRLMHAALVAPQETAFGDTFALAPDGRSIVFEAYEPKSGIRSLWLRPLDSGEATRLTAGDGGEMPFWSPDGAHIGFFADGRLKRLDPRGGPAQVLGDAPTPRGGAWGPDGRIVFAASFRTGLSIVSASGGTVAELTTLDEARHEKSHRFPVFLPSGKSILFLAQNAEGGVRNDESAIEALDLASGKRTRLIAANASPLFTPEGSILFWRDGSLLAQPFDAASLALSGDPSVIAAPVAYTQNEQILASVSTEGTLVYREGQRGTYSSLVWLDRAGGGIRNIRDRDLVDYFALSNDGKRLVFSLNSEGQGATDLWLQEIPGGTSTRFTFEDGGDDHPVWSSDDRFIYYSNDRRNDGVIFRRRADGTTPREEVGTSELGIWPLTRSHDGTWLVIGMIGAESADDLMRFDLETKRVSPLVTSNSVDNDPALSPDDRLLAFASEQSGRYEVYVQALSGSGKWQVSSQGGRNPRWRRDGRELFYLAQPDRVMVVEVTPGDVPRFSAPRELFRQPIQSFAVSADGQEFIALKSADSDLNKPLTLVSGWTRRMR